MTETGHGAGERRNLEPKPAPWVGGRQGASRNGAQGRNRTTDTRIFNPLLYQLSYLGILTENAVEAPRRAVGGVGFPPEAGAL